MSGHDIIVIGASAGGVEALTQLAARLPTDLPAAIFVVIHFPPYERSWLPEILRRAGSMPVHEPRDGEPVHQGRIYIAPPNRQLLLKDGNIRLVYGPREHGFRPAIDPLFRSAAAFGPRVVGVVLSGSLYDGAAGLAAIKQRGGTTIVQDPEEALFSGMPLSAIETHRVDYVLPLDAIAGQLELLARQPVAEGAVVMVDRSKNDKKHESESKIVQQDIDDFEAGLGSNGQTVLVCPDCGGVLWELTEGGVVQYRCHVGHAYSELSLDAQHSQILESALWTAVRTLEDRAALSARLAARAEQRGHAKSASRFREQAESAEQSAELIRQVILNGKVLNLVDTLEPGLSADAGVSPAQKL
jgi:two-component system chemotaxis response regulator CheB